MKSRPRLKTLRLFSGMAIMNHIYNDLVKMAREI
jgi:hypothetical protein